MMTLLTNAYTDNHPPREALIAQGVDISVTYVVDS